MRRREFMRGAGVIAAASALGVPGSTLAAEPPPETTRIALARDPTICPAPMYVAEQILKTEGFTEVRYVPMAADQNIPQLLSSGKADISTDTVPILLLGLEAGDAIVLLGGLHVGCYELFTTPNVKTMRDLKGKTVAISQERDDRHADYDAEDTARFYALRLHEGGMIKSSPQKLLAQSTDWRFFNELKKELKG